MTQGIQITNLSFLRTKSAVLWTSILNEPLWTLYSLFAFILHKDLQCTAIQLGVLMMLKPVASLFSVYWMSCIAKKPHKLLSNVVSAGILSRLPFFAFPFINNIWLLIASAVFYMMLTRGGMPSWVEILKLNLPEKERGVIFSYGSAFGYLEGVALAVGVGYLLDNFEGIWRWIFPLSALIGIVGVFLQSRIPVDLARIKLPAPGLGSVREFVVQPWKSAWQLLKVEKEFRFFQWGIMLCGMGVMVIQPALPLFFIDVLHLSYTELAIALSIWKGVGFAVTSPLWGRWLATIDIKKICAVIFVLMGLFPLLLIFAPVDIMWVYVAYLVYGVAQAGSHLCWNLSGPLFSKEKNSALFSQVNLLTVGLRGCFCPPLGSLLCMGFGPMAVLGIGGALCLFGAARMIQKTYEKSFCNNISDSL